MPKTVSLIGGPKDGAVVRDAGRAYVNIPCFPPIVPVTPDPSDDPFSHAHAMRRERYDRHVCPHCGRVIYVHESLNLRRWVCR